MSDSDARSSSGIGFVSALFLVFLVLKLCGVIDWSWWWVTSPLWIEAAFLAVIGVLVIYWNTQSHNEEKLKRTVDDIGQSYRKRQGF